LRIDLKNRIYFIALILMLPILFTADILIGSISISPSVFIEALSGNDINRAEEIIIFESRIPKALTAVLCGASLSISGLLMQTLFRNPLAGPYILGISSGAGLGVAFLIMGASLFGITLSSSIGLSVAAIIGALMVLFLLLIVSIRVKEVMTLLILGVMLGAIATAIIGLIQFFTTDYQLKSYLFWSLGSLSSVTYSEIQLMFAFIVISIGLSYLFSKNLNALLLGEEYASSIGIKINRSRIVIIVVSGILAGTVTAFCGPIGFVGIVVPHLSRMLFQTTNHRLLIPASLLIGSSLLLFSDLLSSILGNGMNLPINSITALLGIPIILWIIFNKRNISSGF